MVFRVSLLTRHFGPVTETVQFDLHCDLLPHVGLELQGLRCRWLSFQSERYFFDWVSTQRVNLLILLILTYFCCRNCGGVILKFNFILSLINVKISLDFHGAGNGNFKLDLVDKISMNSVMLRYILIHSKSPLWRSRKFLISGKSFVMVSLTNELLFHLNIYMLFAQIVSIVVCYHYLHWTCVVNENRM